MTDKAPQLQLKPSPVHWAVSLVAKNGREDDLEKALMDFMKRSLGQYGSTGAQLVRPAVETSQREFLLHRSFLSKDHSRQFYESDLFREYEAATAELIEGAAKIQPLHGFESFFRGDGGPPPRWKMAIVTWLGVFPAVSIWSAVLSALRNLTSPVAFTAILTLFVVASLTWFIMPRLTAALRPWLHRKQKVVHLRVPCH
jgi:antibiotic biosynthesis monooxygenase (ABM) superfamily enzyme